MVTNTERTAVWDAWLECEYQRRYWHSKASKLSKKERYIQIILALLSSSAVLSALSDIQQLWLWKALSLLTAAVATTQPFLNYTRESLKMCDIGSQWHLLEVEFEAMWFAVENGSFLESKFKDLRNKSVEISRNAADLPSDDQALQKQCQEQVLISRGLK